MPPPRAPPEKADSIPATASRTASSLSERRTTEPVTTSRRRAPGSTRIRTLPSGAARAGCRPCANGCDSPSDEPTKTENSNRQVVSAPRIARSISARCAGENGSPAATGAPALRRARLELLGTHVVGRVHTLARPAEPLSLAAPRLARLVAVVGRQGGQERQERDQRRQPERDQHE